MSLQNETYAQLESNMLSFTDYYDVPVRARNELLVPIVESSNLGASIIRADARPITGDQTYVRRGVRERLQLAGQVLATVAPELKLDVGYGYRALSVQKQRFLAQVATLPMELNGIDRLAAAHRAVAVPEVAGHPAGAAVDIRIINGQVPLDFGTELWNFSKDSYTFSPYVSSEARNNRLLLRSVMMQAGFAPFDGEWWHFSYGDKEWAKYYDQPSAFYEQIEFRAAQATDV